jgi:thiamine kinase-like enzyme
MRLPSREIIKVIIEHHRHTLALDHVGHVDVSFIGQGYANLNVLVTVNQAHQFNLRIGLKNNKTAARKLQNEVDVLRRVPVGIGPRSFVVDLSRTHLPKPYSILQYLPGETKTLWSDVDLETHACRLAQLHQRKFAQHGKFGRLTQAEFDILNDFRDNLHYWQIHYPALFDLATFQRLIPTIRQFVADHAKLFSGLHTFTIVHNDLNMRNMVFHDNRLYYIDWQWTRVGDPALDIASFAWDIDNPPGIMKLTGQRLDMFLTTYFGHKVDATLRQRRDVWMVFGMFFALFFYRILMSKDSTGTSSSNVRQIEAYLNERFL